MNNKDKVIKFFESDYKRMVTLVTYLEAAKDLNENILMPLGMSMETILEAMLEWRSELINKIQKEKLITEIDTSKLESDLNDIFTRKN